MGSLRRLATNHSRDELSVTFYRQHIRSVINSTEFFAAFLGMFWAYSLLRDSQKAHAAAWIPNVCLALIGVLVVLLVNALWLQTPEANRLLKIVGYAAFFVGASYDLIYFT